MPIILPPIADTQAAALGPATLQSLAREVSERKGDLILASPTATGTTTSFVSTALGADLPFDIPKFFVYAYGTSSGAGAVEPANQGVERRSVAWTSATSTLSFTQPFPTPPASLGGVWEIRRDKNRSRVVRAINSALGQLGFYATREFKDETLVGVQNQWRYTLPAGQNWARVTDVEIQQDLVNADYPYRTARAYGLNWRAEKVVDSNGVGTWQIQFASQPPPGYIIRVWGEGFFAELAQETDVLPLQPEHQGMVLEWVYDWAIYRLNAENAEAWATGDAAKATANRESALQKAKQAILEQAKPPKPGRINTPLSQVNGWGEDPNYLGAFTSGGIANTPR